MFLTGLCPPKVTRFISRTETYRTALESQFCALRKTEVQAAVQKIQFLDSFLNFKLDRPAKN